MGDGSDARCWQAAASGGYQLLGGFLLFPEHDLVLFNSSPLPVEGPASSIPPVSSSATMVVDEVPLHSFKQPDGNPVGTVFSAKGDLGELVEVTEAMNAPQETVSSLLKK